MLGLVDHVAAGLGVLIVGEPIANRPHPAANAVACIDDRDVAPAAATS